MTPTFGQLASGRSLGQRLQSLRLQRGWNMDQVAAAAGISRTTLFHLERGAIRRPRASTLHKIAQVFLVPVEILRPPAEPPGGTGPEERTCHSARDHAAPSEQTAVPGPPAGEAIDRAVAHDARTVAAALHPAFGRSLDSLRAFDRLTNPVVTEVAGSNPDLFTGWTADDWDELYSQFATGGGLREDGVRTIAARINNDRETLYRLRVILQTHLADVAAGMVDTLYRLVSVEPQGDMASESPEGG